MPAQGQDAVRAGRTSAASHSRRRVAPSSSSEKHQADGGYGEGRALPHRFPSAVKGRWAVAGLRLLICQMERSLSPSSAHSCAACAGRREEAGEGPRVSSEARGGRRREAVLPRCTDRAQSHQELARVTQRVAKPRPAAGPSAHAQPLRLRGVLPDVSAAGAGVPPERVSWRWDLGGHRVPECPAKALETPVACRTSVLCGTELGRATWALRRGWRAGAAPTGSSAPRSRAEWGGHAEGGRTQKMCEGLVSARTPSRQERQGSQQAGDGHRCWPAGLRFLSWEAPELQALGVTFRFGDITEQKRRPRGLSFPCRCPGDAP